jgi:hypothetical protein
VTRGLDGRRTGLTSSAGRGRGGLRRRFEVVLGPARTQVGRTFPPSEAAAAHAASETGHGRGRIVLRVSGED